MVNWCKACLGAKTTGWIPRWNWLVEEIKWSFPSLLKYIVEDINCEACGGDGYAKPPGWPDKEEMASRRPPSPGALIGNASFPAPPPSISSPIKHDGCDEPRGIIQPAPPDCLLFREVYTNSSGPKK